MIKTKGKTKSRTTKVRRGPRAVAARPETRSAAPLPRHPYTRTLKDGRTIYVELPGEWVTKDRGGELALRPPAMRLLDKLQALAMSTADRAPTPGYLATLRVALGLTQREFAAKLGVDKITVSRWERGDKTPSEESLAKIDEVRKAAVEKGVVVGE